jgi:HEAT repeat protein
MLLIGIAVALAQVPAGGQPPPPTTPPGTVPPTLAPATPLTPPAPRYPSAVGGKSLSEWLKELGESKDGAVRELAVKALTAFGPDAREPALKPLLRACREDADPGVRVNAILTLGAIGANTKEEAKQIVDALVLAINNASLGGVIRLHAARSLANYGHFPEQSNDAIPTLANIARDPSWETRKTVAYALGRVGGPTKDKPDPKPLPPGVRPPPVDPKTGPNPAAMKALLGMLGDSSATVRLEVVEALVVLGPPAVNPEQYSAAVTPYMLAIGERTKAEKDKAVQVWLLMLAMRLDGTQFTDANIGKLVEMGRSAEADVTCQALAALSLLDERARPLAMPFARDMLKHAEPVVVGAAASYLGGAGAAAKPYLPDLEAAKAAAKDEMLKYAIGVTVDAINGRKPPTPGTPPAAAPKK